MLPKRLRSAGYTVEVFREHFPGKPGRAEQGVKDPHIIKFCARQKWVLITTDKNMRFTHRETIKQTDVAIVATTSNNESLENWVTALIKAKASIERHVKKTSRPWFGLLGRTGNLNVQTVTTESYTRRHRPREGQETA